MAKIRKLSIELSKVAENELNEEPARLQKDIDALKAWIKQTPHLKSRDDDQFLVAFLRGCKFSIEKAKVKLDLFYTVRQLTPEVMSDRDPMNKHLNGMIRQGFGLPLPLLEDSSAPRVILIRPGIFNPNFYTIQDAMKVTTMMLDILLNEDDNFVISGQVGVLDLSGVTLQHFLQYNPTFIKKMMTITQDAAPGRLKGLHWINCPRGFEQVFNLFTSMMNEKNRSRLFVHNNYESLHNYIPKHLLPKEYGGDAGTLESIINTWEKRIISYSDYFKDDRQYGTDEKKRLGQQKNSGTLFGVEGSFRQLNID